MTMLLPPATTMLRVAISFHDICHITCENMLRIKNNPIYYLDSVIK
jgi:hypothetical protein